MQDVHGFGLGFRPQFYAEALAQAEGQVDWFEIVSENFFGGGGRPQRFLSQCRERYPMAMHGVGLSIASLSPPSDAYLKNLKSLAANLRPTFISDHICWTRHRGLNTHDLLPVPYTYANLQSIIEHVDQVQDFLGQRLYLENPSAYIAFKGQDFDEISFIQELIARSGCGLLLDFNNLYVNHKNLGLDPYHYLDGLSREDICYIHLAGHTQNPLVRIDTHDQHIAPEVLELYGLAIQKLGAIPTLIEWDDHFPHFDILLNELTKVRGVFSSALLNTSSKEAKEKPTLSSPIPPRDKDPRLYQTFYQLITQDQGLEDFDLDEILDNSRGLTPNQEGIEVYQYAYFSRLKEVMEQIYPMLTKLFTSEAFEKLCHGYLKAMPPEDPDIGQVGARFATYLAEGDFDFDFGVDRKAICDIARLEWALESYYNVPDCPVLSLGELKQLRPEDWEELSFVMTDTWTLIPCSYQLIPVLDALKNGKNPPLPEAKASTYIVYRHQEEMLWEEVSQEELLFLSELAKEHSFYGATSALQALLGESELASVVPDALNFLNRHIARSAIKDYVL